MEVPFGRSMRHFSVMALIVGNACCFRIMGVAKRNGGGLVGAVCLVGVFAKETISVDWFIRECTPRGAGLGRKGRRGRVSQAVRPAGKRLRDSDNAKVLVADDQFVTDGYAPGIEAEMDGGL